MICPTCQNVFAGQASMPATPLLLCMGLFSIFWLGAACEPRRGHAAARLSAQRSSFQSVFAFASLKLRRTPRFALRAPRGCATRSPKGEAWWARQDSNLQPDRYERPALTIELQAPPQECRRGRHATVPPPFTGTAAIRQCRVGWAAFRASSRRHAPRKAGTSPAMTTCLLIRATSSPANTPDRAGRTLPRPEIFARIL